MNQQEFLQLSTSKFVSDEAVSSGVLLECGNSSRVNICGDVRHQATSSSSDGHQTCNGTVYHQSGSQISPE